MKIHHSNLFNEFISFWFETRVDGVLKFETFIDYQEGTWHTVAAGNDEGPVILSGSFASNLLDQQTVQAVKEDLTLALNSGRI